MSARDLSVRQIHVARWIATDHDLVLDHPLPVACAVVHHEQRAVLGHMTHQIDGDAAGGVTS